MEQIETVFGSTDSSDISTAFDSFNSALESLATDSTSSSARTVVLEAANEFCTTLNDAASQLTQLRNDVNSDVKTTADQINSYATQIADLNKQISVASTSGASTNELGDQRSLLVDQLSSLVGVTVTVTDTGSYNINIGDTNLVNGDEVNGLECYTVTDSASDQYGMYGIRWANSGEDLDAGDTGALSGYLELRDGSSSDNKGIPYYLSQLDEFARTFAQAFNEGVTSGTTTYNGHADGAGIAGSTGTRFFSYDDLSSAELMASEADTEAVYQNITAANISVAKDIQEDTDKIATSAAAGEDENTDNIDDMISICEEVSLSGKATVNDLYNTIVAAVGTDSSYAQTEYERKDAIATYINTSRESVSGVSSDEETVNLTVYQSAYEASATMMSTWSEIYQTTINMVDD